jgi:hypothetical protein
LPATVCTVGADGLPNISYVCDVTLVDDDHVCLSNQFLRKTKANLVERGAGQVNVVEPGTFRQFRLDVEYVEERSEGPLFDEVSARIDAIASMTGQVDVFSLRSLMILRVLEVGVVDCGPGDD